MVFYRKYRPQKIDELDSQNVRDKLYSVLGSQSISHAYIFTGPKGLGKTSTARIVAKVLNCERKAKSNKKQETRIEPCNKCNQCVSITNGTNLDILEIDGASNRGIDEIRDLREKVKLSPLSSRKKVYIIDEVHMLTQEAFNALLKTLEEPPSHVVFILCTTEPHKVPATIMSRCLNIQFQKATEEELVRSFERIIKAEKIKSDKEALGLIAGLSDGSFRDGVKILEEIIHSAGRKKITKDLIEQKYQISNIRYKISSILEFLENKDTKKSLELVSKLAKEGTDMKFFIEELINVLHNNLLFKAGVDSVIQNSEFRLENSKLTMEEVKRLIELLSKAHSELKYAILPQIPLELAIVEWGIQVPAEAGPVRSFPPRHRQGLGGQAASDKALPAPFDGVGSPSSSATRSSSPATPHSDTSVISHTAQQNITGYSENDALWTTLIDRVKTYNHSIAGVLRGCSVKSYDGRILVIEAKFKFHKERLNEPKTQEILTRVGKEITKKNIEVEVILKER